MAKKRIAADLDLMGNQLISVALENLAADPTGAELYKGRVWYNTVSNVAKYYDGTTVQTLANLENVLDTPLNAFAVPVADMDINGNKITNLAAGVADTDATNKLQMENAIQAALDSIASGISYEGAFDASAESFDAIADALQGNYYKITVAGTIDGVDYNVGDSIIVNKDVTGTPVTADIDKIDSTEAADILRTGNVDEDTLTVAGGILKATANAFRNNNKYVTTIGDGVGSVFTVTHNLGVETINVVIYDTAGTKTDIDIPFARTGVNAIELDFGSHVPGVDEYTVVVIG